MKRSKKSPVLEPSMNEEQVQEDVGGRKGFGGAPFCHTQHRSFQPKLYVFSSDIQARKGREETDKKNAYEQ